MEPAEIFVGAWISIMIFAIVTVIRIRLRNRARPSNPEHRII